MIFNPETNQKVVMTSYDTGTQDNHMSLAVAKDMNLEITIDKENKGKFALPTGAIIESLGRTSAKVRFANRSAVEESTMMCFFNIFKTLAHPVCMGMTFLGATETLSKHTFRLVDVPGRMNRPLRLCSLGDIASQVSCEIDGKRAIAQADTGSEIALISGKFAHDNGLRRREYGCEEIMLADGSIVYTSGCADVFFSVSKSASHLKKRDVEWGRIRFHVLDNLHFDALLDEDLVDQFDVFGRNAQALISTDQPLIPILSPIIHLRSVERTISQGVKKAKVLVKLLIDPNGSTDPEASTTQSKPPSRFCMFLWNENNEGRSHVN
jgi:hypothetical protein